MPNYTETNSSIFKPLLPPNKVALSQLRESNNPNNDPVGDFTGRCAHCGSTDLWDDNLAYGCNSCRALLAGN